MIKYFGIFTLFSQLIIQNSYAISADPLSNEFLGSRSICLIRRTVDHSTGPRCTAEIVDEHTVITAAHCFYDDFTTLIDVSQLSVACNSQIEPLMTYAIHPEYLSRSAEDISKHSDVALIRVKNGFSAVVPFQFDRKNPKRLSDCRVAGYGYDRDWKNAGIYREANVAITNTDAITGISSFMGAVTRPGDSGGALFCRYRRSSKLSFAGILGTVGWGTEAISIDDKTIQRLKENLNP